MKARRKQQMRCRRHGGGRTAACSRSNDSGGSSLQIVTRKRQCHAGNLPAQIQPLDHFLITLVVFGAQIVQKLAAAGHKHQQTTTRRDVFAMARKMLGQVADPFGQERDLNVGASCIVFVDLVIRYFFRSFTHHSSFPTCAPPWHTRPPDFGGRL